MPRPLVACMRATCLLILFVLITTPVGRPAAAETTVLHRDGDLVVVDAETGTAYETTRAYGDGYAIYREATLLESYLIRLHTSPGIEDIRPHLDAAATTIRNEVGLAITVAPGQYRDVEPGSGTIDVIVASRARCFGSWLGCASPGIDDGKIQHAEIWLNPRLLDRDPHVIDNTVRHELGHGLGLAHYDARYDGEIQTMHSASFDASSYRRGDLNGLRHLNRERQGPAVRATPTSSTTTTTTTTTTAVPTTVAPVVAPPVTPPPPPPTTMPPAPASPPPEPDPGAVVETAADDPAAIAALDVESVPAEMRLPTGDDRSRLAIVAGLVVLADVVVLVRRRRWTAP